jgi:hypothetical protein
MRNYLGYPANLRNREVRTRKKQGISVLWLGKEKVVNVSTHAATVEVYSTYS